MYHGYALWFINLSIHLHVHESNDHEIKITCLSNSRCNDTEENRQTGKTGTVADEIAEARRLEAERQAEREVQQREVGGTND